MIRRKQPATVVLCATAPRQAITGRSRVWLESVRSVAVPVTWAVGIDTLADIAGQDHGLDLALDIPPAACGSRSRLREILLRGRDLMPDLAAVVLRGPTPAANRGVLVEKGIGVAVVAAFEEESRGNLRPAPKGWACRNPVWGLWEVLVTPARPAGIAGWLGFGGIPRLSSGGLQVLRTDGVSVGNNGAASLAPRLERWISWAGQQRFRGTASVVPLSMLPRLISGGDREAVGRSVLRAA
jgi:hypothetical protein